MSKQVRVRFAPSPTGPLHIGGVRTALFNYLFAKKNNGVFFLRIEDTDQNRFVPGAEEYIMESLEWLGIAPDETIGKNEKFGPYKQSERKHLYLKYADDLINSGNAYYAFDTAEALDLHRKQHEEQGKTFIYNWHNREKLDTSLVISAEETAKRIAAGEEYVIRFKTPVDETLQLQDIIRGEVKFETNLLDDKVLFKSDGMPTYHLANIVDDHLMETSHVIRGEEWLPSMPLHVLLYRAFGWEAPQFAHLPLILKPVGNGKLSKRDGDKLGFPVFPLEWKTEDGISSGYREKGFFPETVINFLALLGWNDGTEQEIFTLEELVDKFDLNRVHKAGAKFDPEKNKWFNHQYLMKQSDSDLAEDFAPIVAEKGFSSFDCAQGDTLEMTKLEKIVSLIKERANFVSEFWDLSDFFFVAPTSYDEKARKNWKEETPALMQELISVLSEISDFTSVNIETIVKDWMTKNEIGMGKVMQPFRLSLVGALKGPHLFDIVELIGKEETIKRIEKAIASL
ncbi:glutamate--tRNA ligase [Flavobacterium franklandianum]|uniref:glutamate--tRNA ligase n=1 Tax=Flavobacterium franklandianum TaxID=2594430 RepID=UPI00117AE1C5|nr:glutamate--tRNA ligase [Flavobacterium franklandianum]TRX26986.1 glutamate--tRNA ligase [Flavobacterium franklandianum]